MAPQPSFSDDIKPQEEKTEVILGGIDKIISEPISQIDTLDVVNSDRGAKEDKQVDQIDTLDEVKSDCEQILNNQVSVQEEFVSEQSDIVLSGTFTFKQVQIINPDVISASQDTDDNNFRDDDQALLDGLQSDTNIKGILKKKNQNKVIEVETNKTNSEVLESITPRREIDNSQDDFISDDLIDVSEGLDESEIIINRSEKSLPDVLADTISLTSIESAAPPLPESTPPSLPVIPPPTPVLSRKIEVRQPHIDIEKKADLITMEDQQIEEEIIQIQSSAKVQSAAPSNREEVISPHSQRVADMRAEFFGISKSLPLVKTEEENVPDTTGMDVYLNDLQLEAKTKELEENDSDLSDTEEDRKDFEAVFTPGMSYFRIISNMYALHG